MRKILTIILLLSLTAAIAGCGNEASSISSSVSTVASTPALSTEASAETTVSSTESSDLQQADAPEEEPAQTPSLSNDINDYTIEDIPVFIGDVLIETDYYYGPSEAFDIYKDVIDGHDMGHPTPGLQAIVYGKCKETGWWRLDLGRSGDYPIVFVPEECIKAP